MPTSLSPSLPIFRCTRTGSNLLSRVRNPWTGFRIRTPDTKAGNLETGSIVFERLENRIYRILFRIG
jgi:hypothetical protein